MEPSSVAGIVSRGSARTTTTPAQLLGLASASSFRWL